MKNPEEDPLIDVAGSIAEGKPVDWDHLNARTVDEPAEKILDELRVIEDIASFHTGVALPSNPSPPQRPHSDTASSGADGIEPTRWGHLTIFERIGEGRSGRVYRARDEKLESEVALKLVTELWGGLDEARRLARVRHPHVVLVYGADEIDGHVGVWMELIKGRTLAAVLRATGRLGAREAASIGRDLCSALAAIHGQDLIHGDIKAHNVMREDGGRIVLMDFGAGKDLRVGSPLQTTDFAGTPLYLPPEIFNGGQRAHATDIYALGVLLYHLVTDSYPVQGRTVDDVERAHARGERTHLRDVRPDLPDSFVSVVERALARHPKDRYETAGAFESALARSLDLDAAPAPFWTLPRIITGLALAALVTGVVSQALLAGRFVRLATPPTDAVKTAPASYQIQTALYRDVQGQRVRLRPGERLEPGAELFAEVRASIPTYVYLINEDERGSAYTLFPMPNQSATNPLPANSTVRLPGNREGKPLNWLVDTPGQREHFLVFASPTPLTEYEKVFDALPHPELGKPVMPLTPAAVGALRSVGGLVAAPNPIEGSLSQQTGHTSLSLQFTTPLGDAAETVTGVWICQLTVDNPAK